MKMRFVSYRRLVEGRKADLQSAMHAIVKDYGNGWIEVDHRHKGYPRTRLALPRGPGTELKRLLARLGIKPKPNCACTARAGLMDKNGPDWCEENISQIVGWLKEEHAKRQSIIPFIPLAAEQLVRLAIRRARKKGNGK